jgi:hypothetical protein
MYRLAHCTLDALCPTLPVQKAKVVSWPVRQKTHNCSKAATFELFAEQPVACSLSLSLSLSLSFSLSLQLGLIV